MASIYNFPDAAARTYNSPTAMQYQKVTQNTALPAIVLFENGILNNFPCPLSYNIRSFNIYVQFQRHDSTHKYENFSQ